MNQNNNVVLGLLEALKRARIILCNETAAENQPWGARILEQIDTAIAKAEGSSK